MHTININISETREVTIDFKTAGNIAENNETLLSFEIPKEYSSYYKYLDILKEKGEKTQTVVSTDDENKFSYKLPYELTDGRCLYLQLVLKKGENVFKSNIFSIMFNGGICAGQHLVGDYQDIIQFIMENKSDKKDIENLNKDVYRKLDSNIFYSHLEVQETVNNKKADKEEGKGLSENDYTSEEKEKLLSLPNSSELNSKLNLKMDKEDGKGLSEENFTTLLKEKLEGITEDNLIKVVEPIFLEDGREDFNRFMTNEASVYSVKGGYYIIGGDRKWYYSNITIYTQTETGNDILIRFNTEGITIYFCVQPADNNWEKQTFDFYSFTNKADKSDTLSGYGIKDAYTKEEINLKIGNIDSALDELHSYAQAIINGGA